jgi:hypothetical protein
VCFFFAESRTSRLSANLTDVGGRDGCGCGAVSRTFRRELRVESSRRRCCSPWASPSPRARPCALGEEGLHRELEIWLSPKLPALGEDSVSGSVPYLPIKGVVSSRNRFCPATVVVTALHLGSPPHYTQR